MRVLFLTNFYRVQETGGEDQSCQQVVQGLTERGHTTLVLTSMHGTDNVPVKADGVYRYLYLEMDLVPWQHSLTFFTHRKARERHNLRCFEQVLEEFAPDIVFIWGMWNLPSSLAAVAESRYPDNVVYRFATYWPTLPSQHELYWRAPGRTWYSKLAKKVLGKVGLAILARENQRSLLTFKHAICVSATTRSQLVEAGIPVDNARVIHTGIDPEKYLINQAGLQPNIEKKTLNLLCAGRLVPEKGLDTAIQALQKLIYGRNMSHIRLSVAGSGSADYLSYLRGLVTQAGLEAYVSFLGHVHPEDMPRLLQQSDVLVMPSTWQEPFSRIVLEGMISGLVVVATPTGGTTEILRHGENGLLFTPGDSEDLARKIAQLVEDPASRIKLANAGHQTVIGRFTRTRMLDEIENYLDEVAHPFSDKSGGQLEHPEKARIRPAPPTISIVIPTYNRKDQLRETLQSLVQQTHPSDRFEVIIVDDGSTDGTETIASETFPFVVRYFWQTNQGDAAARNFGARESQADILVFLDDDILVAPDYLAHLSLAHLVNRNRIVIGTAFLWLAETSPISQSSKPWPASDEPDTLAELPFRDVCSNNMSLDREAYFKIGGMQGLDFQGSSMWCDLDFSYRAYQQGFEFFRSTTAICWHRDYTARSLADQKKRATIAAYRSVKLFQKYPGLLELVPMFSDKTPINWHQDSPFLIARKVVRMIASIRPVLWSLEQIAHILEKYHPKSGILSSLYRYIIGGHLFLGYRDGLSKFGPVDQKEKPVLLA